MISDITLKGTQFFGDNWELLEGKTQAVCFKFGNSSFVFEDTAEDRADFELIFSQFGAAGALLEKAKGIGSAVMGAGKNVAEVGTNLIHSFEKQQDFIADKIAKKVSSIKEIEDVERSGIRKMTEFLIKQGMLWGAFPSAILGIVSVLGAPLIVALLIKAILWMPIISKIFKLVKQKVQMRFGKK